MQNTPLYAESWNVAYRMAPQGSILSDRESPFTILPNSLRYWAADPMVFSHGAQRCIFAELYDYVRCRGILGVSQFDGTRFGKWTPILVEEHHLSYPYVFEWAGQVYLMPESGDSGQLCLYRAVEFPLRWEKCRVIARDVHWVDTTILPRGDGFVGFTEDAARGKDLRLTLDRSFQITSAAVLEEIPFGQHRMGGRPFPLEGRMVVVCQDCDGDYGKALLFRGYDPDLLSQDWVQRIAPQALRFDRPMALNGMHTYSADDAMEVIDLKTRRFNLLNLCFRLLQKIRPHSNILTQKRAKQARFSDFTQKS